MHLTAIRVYENLSVSSKFFKSLSGSADKREVFVRGFKIDEAAGFRTTDIVALCQVAYVMNTESTRVQFH